jgi:hypothetical protein
MKTLPLPLLSGIALLALSVASVAESVQELLTQAQVAYQKGEIETAKEAIQIRPPVGPPQSNGA